MFNTLLNSLNQFNNKTKKNNGILQKIKKHGIIHKTKDLFKKTGFVINDLKKKTGNFFGTRKIKKKYGGYLSHQKSFKTKTKSSKRRSYKRKSSEKKSFM